MSERSSFFFSLFLTLFGVFFSVILISWVNYEVISAWFGKNGPANIGSIEVSYVSMGRFLKDFGLPFPGGSSWMPFWYFGFPFDLFYTPLLPLLEAFLHGALGMPLWETYRFLTGVAYILSPISVFFLGWQLSKRVVGGLIAGLLYSVGPTIFYFLNSEVAGDKFSSAFWDPRRFTILVRWGEGPHLFSLIFVPLVGVFFARFLEKKRFGFLLLSSLFLGLAGLSNALGFFAALLLLGAMAFVRCAQEGKDKRKTLLYGFLSGAIALGLISFWYNLSFITNFFAEGEGAGSVYLSLFPWGWVGLIGAVVVLYFFFGKVLRSFATSVALLWFGIFFLVVGAYYFSASPYESFRRIELLPQALRYMTEVDLSLSLLIGVAFASIIGWLRQLVPSGYGRGVEFVGNGIGVGLSLALLWYVQPFIPVAKEAGEHVVDLSKTREYAIASWLAAHVDEKKGERVFVPGNYGFYLNWFTNVWQHRGGLFQASTHPWPDHMHYQMANGTDPEIAYAWLVIANARYAVLTHPGSAELYREVKNLARFDGLPIAMREQGDVIYEVPRKRASLAKPVDLAQMSSLTAPVKGDDKVALLSYADWIESSSHNQTSLIVVNHDTYQITGTVGEGEGILVQMTYDEGWRVQGKGLQVQIGKDPLGFLILYPGAGEVDVVLRHGPTWKQWVGYGLTIATLIFVVGYPIVNQRRDK